MDQIAKVFNSIANEEITHVGELEFMLEKIDPSYDKYEDKGEDEAEELTGWDEDDEVEEQFNLTGEVTEGFAKLVHSTVIKGKRVPVRKVASRVKQRAAKRYAKHKTREQSKK